MALTYSPNPDLGKKCPDFRLHSVDGEIFSLDDFSGAKILVFFFICNHCPYVKAVEDRLIHLGQTYPPKQVAFIAICSNEPSEHPEDAPAELLKRWHEKSYPFPYLVDDTQKVARAFGAVCTPDIFVYDGNRKLSYRGRLEKCGPRAKSRTENGDRQPSPRRSSVSRANPDDGLLDQVEK
jgi:peroxiredoxin